MSASIEMQKAELQDALRALRSTRYLTGYDVNLARRALGWKRSQLATRCGEYAIEDVEAWETDKQTLPLQAKACILCALECELKLVESW
jgi:DNA-binding transcriptional regulator YiaG